MSSRLKNSSASRGRARGRRVILSMALLSTLPISSGCAPYGLSDDLASGYNPAQESTAATPRTISNSVS